MRLRSLDPGQHSFSGPAVMPFRPMSAKAAEVRVKAGRLPTKHGLVGGCALLLFLAWTPPLTGQEVVVRVQENFRAEPGGSLLAELAPGTRLTVLQEQDGWTQAALTGHVWVPSVQQRQTSTIHGLVVSAPGGENLRDEPAGRIAGRLLSGMVLEELGRATDWVHVRRVGWIWGGSVEAAGPAVAGTAAATVPPVGPPSGPPAAPPPEAGAAPPAAATPPPAATPPAGAPSATAPPAAAPPVDAPPAAPLPPPASAGPPAGALAADGWLRTGGRGVPILTAPDGDTLGRSGPGSDLRVVSREGNWARVQLEGWIWVPGLDLDADPSIDAATVLTDVRVADLSRDYERYRGRLVEIELQYISLERAEQVRPDFFEGEPFLLTRSMDGDRSFVYVAVPPESMASVGALAPLDRIRVVARVRSGAAAFTGSPILDLMELTRVR